MDLARMWGFEAIRQHIIKELAILCTDDVEKTVLAHKYYIEEWYADVYFALAKREDPLTIEESRRIGWETAMKIAWVREKKYSLALTCSSKKVTKSIYHEPPRMSDVELGRLVETTLLKRKIPKATRLSRIYIDLS